MSLSPIVLFVYNRPWHTRQTLEALRKNPLAIKSDLYVFADGPKDVGERKSVGEVRALLHRIGGFRKINLFERENNFGLADSVIGGVTEVISKHGRVIVLEDDLVTAPGFLKFMNEALQYYREEPRVFTICGYNHPPNVLSVPDHVQQDVYFNPRPSSWGWGTWEDRWREVDWPAAAYRDFRKDRSRRARFNLGGEDLAAMLDSQMGGRLDSWAVRWCFWHFLKHGLALMPVRSLVDNIGLDGTGRHSGEAQRLRNDLERARSSWIFPGQVAVDEEMMRRFRAVYRPPFRLRVKIALKRLFQRSSGK